MKIFNRMPRNLKKSVIFTLLFCFLFPWSLAAEISQKAPANSLSYFLETEGVSGGTSDVDSTAHNIPPLDFENTSSKQIEPSANKTDRTAAIEAMRARLAAKSNEPVTAVENVISESKSEIVANPTSKKAKASEKIKKQTSKVQKVKKQKKADVVAVTVSAVEVVAQAEPEMQTTSMAPVEKARFAGTLERMLQSRAQRIVEAEKLGVVLPSQGGDIATVSPSLSKMQQTIRSIISR